MVGFCAFKDSEEAKPTNTKKRVKKSERFIISNLCSAILSIYAEISSKKKILITLFHWPGSYARPVYSDPFRDCFHDDYYDTGQYDDGQQGVDGSRQGSFGNGHLRDINIYQVHNTSGDGGYTDKCHWDNGDEAVFNLSAVDQVRGADGQG